jgi:hypothetical protein
MKREKSIKNFPSVTRRRRGQFFLHTYSLDLESSRPHLGQLSVLHTQNFEIQVHKGSHLREVF